MVIDYGKKMLNLRKSLGLSQAMFADKLGVQRYQIASVEHNKNKPTLELITSVINNYQIKSDYFFLPNAEIVRYDGSILKQYDGNMSDNNSSLINEPSQPLNKPTDESRIIKSLEDHLKTKDITIKAQQDTIEILKLTLSK